MSRSCAPGLDPQVSCATLSNAYPEPVADAALRRTLAEAQAGNNSQAQPDAPSAAAWYGWCGGTDDLTNDGLVPLTGERIADPAWFCSDTAVCLARHRARYPDAEVPAEVRDRLVLAQAAAAPALLALTAFQGALQQAAAQRAGRSRSAHPGWPPGPAQDHRPGPPSRRGSGGTP